MWKASKIFHNTKFRILLIIELLLAAAGAAGLFQGSRPAAALEGLDHIVMNAGTFEEEGKGYYIDSQWGYNGTFLEAGGISLKPGVYELVLEYETGDNGVNSFGVKDDTVSFRGLRANDVSLYSGQSSRSCRFYLMENTDALRVTVDYSGTGSLSVHSFTIYTSSAGSRIFLFWVILLSLIVDSLVMVYLYQKNRKDTQENLFGMDRKAVLMGIPVIALLGSIPVFVDYMIFGADLSFHLLRIEALADSLGQGIFPAWVEPMWLYGHGYASSLFYCDTFLLIPALLRLLGFSVQTSYHLFVITVNLATAWIAYVSFRGCFRKSQGERLSRFIGLFGSLLYTLAPYRIYNIYNRGAVGEYTAMIFLPLLCYGFYMIFTQDIHSREYKRYWLIPVLGFTGIIQSHVLTCEIVGFFTVLLCVALIRRVFRKETFAALVKAAGVTALLNLWFLIPFLDMMVSGNYNFSRIGQPVQERGIFPAHIFYTMQKAGSSSRFQDTGMAQTEPIGVGIAILLGTAAYLLLHCMLGRRRSKAKIVTWQLNHKGQSTAEDQQNCQSQKDAEDRRNCQSAAAAFLLGAAAIVMSTCYFPWDWLQSLNPVASSLVSSLQFPTRLTVISTLCLVFVCCVAALWAMKLWGRTASAGFFLTVCGACIVFSLFQTGDTLLTNDGAVRLYSGENLGHSAVAGGEYLPLGTDVTAILYHGANPSDGVEVEEYAKEGLDVSAKVKVSDTAEGAFVELPLLYYKGYRARDVQTGENFETLMGTNGDVLVMLPAGYEGIVRTWYAGMWYWRAAQVISALTALSLAAIWIFRIGKRKKNGSQD